MTQTKIKNQHPFLSVLILVCGLLYIFASQFKLPFKADTFLYGMVFGSVVMTLFSGRIALSGQVGAFFLVAISSFLGTRYTTMPAEGVREAILFAFYAVLFMLSLTNLPFVELFNKWVYILSVAVVFSSVIHFMIPSTFNSLMQQVLRQNAYEQLMLSFDVDGTFAGFMALTSSTTFSAAIVFGNSFLTLVNKNRMPVIKNKVWNIALLALSMFCIILCSKRGIFVASLAAWLVLFFYLYRKKNVFFKFLGAAVLFSLVMLVLYNTNEFVAGFLDRFTGNDLLTGRDDIYRRLLNDFSEGSLWLGRGTGATYDLANKGARNIYIQILYDHGILLSLPYYFWLLYNYVLAFKNKCPISIFVQTMFLVYGLSGNPLYSNMFMIIYVYMAAYAALMPTLEKHDKQQETVTNVQPSVS